MEMAEKVKRDLDEVEWKIVQADKEIANKEKELALAERERLSYNKYNKTDPNYLIWCEIDRVKRMK